MYVRLVIDTGFVSPSRYVLSKFQCASHTYSYTVRCLQKTVYQVRDSVELNPIVDTCLIYCALKCVVILYELPGHSGVFELVVTLLLAMCTFHVLCSSPRIFRHQ